MFWLVLLIVILVIKLVFITAMHVRRSPLSRFELERRATAGDRSAKHALDRERVLGDVVSIKRAITSLLLVAIALLSVVTFGWLNGTLIAVFVALEYRVIARLGLVQRAAGNIYQRFEQKLLNFVQKAPYVTMFFRTIPKTSHASDQALNSKEELEYLIDQSGEVLTEQQRTLLKSTLQFNDKKVRDIMTPREKIESVAKNEVLGPLVLDELHKTGYGRIPVINRDLDHVVGVLMIRDLLIIDTDKRPRTVDKAMDPRVFHILASQPLIDALAVFLNTDARLLIVANKEGRTVGLVTLGDIIEALLGARPVDTAD